MMADKIAMPRSRSVVALGYITSGVALELPADVGKRLEDVGCKDAASRALYTIYLIQMVNLSEGRSARG